ncbi:MAG: DNA repair protein RecN [Crocinitomicaceae bacterium]
MLNRLEISNYALIENAIIRFESGFTTITGETGAGKSILLKALNLLLGDRADTSILKQSEKKCFLEAEFKIDHLNLKSFFDENDLDFESPCIIRREFTTSGKSRCFVNDSPVQIAILKELGGQLVNIHSQHQTLHLFEKNFQLDVLDNFADQIEQIQDYKEDFKQYRERVNRHIELQLKDKENRKEKDYLEFLINELNLADLDNVNLEELKIANDRIEFSEKISDGLGLSVSVFENETYGPLNGIKTLIETFEELKSYDPIYADLHGRLISLKIELQDIQSDIEAQANNQDFSEVDAVAIKEKMDLLNSLCFKHNLSEVAELIELKAKLEQDMAEIDGVEDELNKIGIQIEADKKRLKEKALAIRKNRVAHIPKLTSKIKTSLDQLSMEDAEIEIQLEELERLSINGLDQIDLLFKTNKGGQFLPLKKIASGGELSRLMLSIMSILSECKNLPTLIFDEIDTGVSGEVASKIANEFVKMGSKIQLIAITHLPQVASRGAQHLHVSKNNDTDKTQTNITQLNQDKRVEEIAKMISGAEITDAAKENALHLLNIS